MEAIEFTEKELFDLFSSIEKRVRKLSNKEYYAIVNSPLPPTCSLEPDYCIELNSAISQYKRKNSEQATFAELVRRRGNEISLSVHFRKIHLLISQNFHHYRKFSNLLFDC